MVTLLYNTSYNNNVDPEGVDMYVMEDVATGRFLNKRSVEFGESVIFYTTYSGKIGTDFYKTMADLEIDKERMCQLCGQIGKIIHTVNVNPDSMCLGRAVIEIVVKK